MIIDVGSKTEVTNQNQNVISIFKKFWRSGLMIEVPSKKSDGVAYGSFIETTSFSVPGLFRYTKQAVWSDLHDELERRRMHKIDLFLRQMARIEDRRMRRYRLAVEACKA